MIRILLVEDDPILGKGLKLSLGLQGYEVIWARTISEAEILIKELNLALVALVVLDVGLPDGSGIEFCRRLRKAGSALPVLILTARSDEDSVVDGLQAGANDYVRKPFGQRELMARIKVAIRDIRLRDDEITYGPVRVVQAHRKVYIADQELEFNRREYEIFLFLLNRAGTVVSRESLLRDMDKEGEIFDRTIDSHLSHIRSKLKRQAVSMIQIKSIYGVGYTLETL